MTNSPKGTTAKVLRLPACDICGEPAAYDSPITYRGRRTWAFTCEKHWKGLSSGKLGVGLGQRLVVEE